MDTLHRLEAKSNILKTKFPTIPHTSIKTAGFVTTWMKKEERSRDIYRDLHSAQKCELENKRYTLALTRLDGNLVAPLPPLVLLASSQPLPREARMAVSRPGKEREKAATWSLPLALMMGKPKKDRTLRKENRL